MLLKHIAVYHLVRALIYIVIGYTLYMCEDLWLFEHIVAMQQLPYVIIISVILFLYGIVTSMIYNRVARRHSQMIMPMYLFSTSIRLMIIVVTFIFYAFIIRINLVAFALNLFVFYLVEMICSVAYSIKTENIQS